MLGHVAFVFKTKVKGDEVVRLLCLDTYIASDISTNVMSTVLK